MRPSKWTRDLDSQLLALKNDGRTFKWIGRALGLGESSIKSRLRNIGYYHRVRKPVTMTGKVQYWTSERNDELRKHLRLHRGIDDVADRMGVTVTALRVQLARLGISRRKYAKRRLEGNYERNAIIAQDIEFQHALLRAMVDGLEKFPVRPTL